MMVTAQMETSVPRRICAWCEEPIDLDGDGGTSHGICEPCLSGVARRLVPKLREGGLDDEDT